MDIVIELEGGNIANVEVQKIGYLFPGQRCACYSADLLLRQYKRVRGEKNKEFSYRNIKDVYTIVLFEKSPREFKDYPDTFYHFFEQKSDTGLKMEFLQKYIFIPLDIFRKSQQNKNIRKKRDAWLSLFSSDDPETIIKLIERYPEFRKIYEEGYEICRNIEKVMEMFSKELQVLDKNTVMYMIDDLQDKVDAQKEELDQKQGTIDVQKEELDQKQGTIDAQKEELNNQQKKLNQQEKKIQEMQEEKEKMYIEGIKSTVKLLRSLNVQEREIIRHIGERYQINEEQAYKYL